MLYNWGQKDWRAFRYGINFQNCLNQRLLISLTFVDLKTTFTFALKKQSTKNDSTVGFF